MTEVSVALACADGLGEGPWWDVTSQALRRVDIYGQKVPRWEPESGEGRSWTMPEPVGCFVPGASGLGGIVAMRNALAWFEFESSPDAEVMWLLDIYLRRRGGRALQRR
ncbi:MAG: SMP-30/gluconolactonase/LRE family protein [Pseudomonadales bacterium]|jgi:sugar lactone lactonase YvrE|nr:SMP-30/gluconolactonase/LRE family protein [Pseudomonadales bacterium]MDP6471826.1 SMP-30/gluconolactonase/LRE family protein [Pseudomonadales bacterium]MDP6828760.1 SMP-30/gluconolactonase/LRE family protein [Pseudomonadales bacterium]MDP6970307.1 SMP-30/gluconolactonase/LRE family protein [Pseudomonadales bacterium]|tara:strand:+ start:893 stop:1219 length:327 start_codon:yes stop_codon:yes gene_type:complete